MRDAKLLFHPAVDPSTASLVVDTDSSRPGVGIAILKISASYSEDTIPSGVTCTVSSSDTEGGAQAAVAVFNVTAGPTNGGVILSTPLPSETHRFVTTTWSGLTGGLLTDGIDWGITDGTEPTQPYNA